MNKKGLIIWVIGLSLGCSILMFFVILPAQKNITRLKDEVGAEEVLLAQRKKQKTELTALTRQYEEIKNNVSQLETAFIAKDTRSLLGFIESIEKLAEQQNLTHSISISEIPKPDDVKTLESEMHISITGSYQGIYAFTALLEKQPAYVTLSSFSVTEQGTQPNSSYTADMTGKVFWK